MYFYIKAIYKYLFLQQTSERQYYYNHPCQSNQNLACDVIKYSVQKTVERIVENILQQFLYFGEQFSVVLDIFLSYSMAAINAPFKIMFCLLLDERKRVGLVTVLILLYHCVQLCYTSVSEETYLLNKLVVSFVKQIRYLINC